MLGEPILKCRFTCEDARVRTDKMGRLGRAESRADPVRTRDYIGGSANPCVNAPHMSLCDFKVNATIFSLQSEFHQLRNTHLIIKKQDKKPYCFFYIFQLSNKRKECCNSCHIGLIKPPILHLVESWISQSDIWIESGNPTWLIICQ